MTNPDYRTMCAELLLFSEEAVEICMNESLWPKSDPNCTLLDRARALLAQPEPKGPTDEELVNFRNRATADCCASRSNNGANLLSGDDLVACQAAGLRAVLARWGHPTPQPVAVSERLPGPEDCNDEGYCWWWRTDEVGEWWEFLYLRDARDHNRRCGLARYTHWLPYHAIPNLPNPND